MLFFLRLLLKKYCGVSKKWRKVWLTHSIHFFVYCSLIWVGVFFRGKNHSLYRIKHYSWRNSVFSTLKRVTGKCKEFVVYFFRNVYQPDSRTGLKWVSFLFLCQCGILHFKCITHTVKHFTWSKNRFFSTPTNKELNSSPPSPFSVVISCSIRVIPLSIETLPSTSPLALYHLYFIIFFFFDKGTAEIDPPF